MADLIRPRIRRKAVPDYLRDRHGIDIAYAILENLAVNGGGPLMEYCRIPLYRPEALDAWAEAKLSRPVASTAERRLA